MKYQIEISGNTLTHDGPSFRLQSYNLQKWPVHNDFVLTLNGLSPIVFYVCDYVDIWDEIHILFLAFFWYVHQSMKCANEWNTITYPGVESASIIQHNQFVISLIHHKKASEMKEMS